MVKNHKELSRILEILKDNPRGMSVKQIAEAVGMNRISVARYLDVLQIAGEVDMVPYGQAKVYHLSHRVPVSALLNFSSDFVMVLGPGQRIVQANTNMLELLDESLDNIVNKHFFDVLHPLSADPFLQEKIDLALAGEEVVEQIRIIKDEKELYFNMKVIPTVFSDGSPGITMILEDITEHKRSLDALIASEEQYRSLVENLNDMIFRVDADGTLTYLSPRSLALLGYDPGEMVGHSAFEFLTPDSKAEMKEALRIPAQPGEEVQVFEATLLHRSGREVILELSITPQFDEEGTFTGFRGISRDITYRKRMEGLVIAQRDLALALSVASTREEALPLSVETTVRISDLDSGGIYLIENEAGDFYLFYSTGLSDDFVRDFSRVSADSKKGALMHEGKPVYSPDPRLAPSGDEEKAFALEGVRSFALIPILSQENVVACFNMASHTLDEIPDFSRRALESIAASLGSIISRIETVEALRSSEEKYRMLFNNAHDSIYLLQLDENGMPGDFTEVNDALCTRLGYTREELLNMAVREINSGEGWKNMPTVMEQLRKEGHVTYEGVHISKDGVGIPVEISSHLFELDNEPVILSIARDLRFYPKIVRF
jgi:PAS domain S-box-containing protein